MKIKIKNRAMVLASISALVISSVCLAMLVANNLSMSETQEHHSIPVEAFEGLGGKKGVGFGDWYLEADTNMTIYSYPAGEDVSKSRRTITGWDNILEDMLITITVTADLIVGYDNVVNVTIYYLKPYFNETSRKTNWTPENTTLRLGRAFPQSTTFMGQIYLVNIHFSGTLDDYATGHYFVSIERLG